MVHRINAIDNEILSCMTQLQSIMPEYMYDEYLGVYLDSDVNGGGLRDGQVRPSRFTRKPYSLPVVTPSISRPIQNTPKAPPNRVTPPTPPQTINPIQDTGPITGSADGDYLVRINSTNVLLDFKYKQTPEDQANIVTALNNSQKFQDWCASINTGSTFTTNRIVIHDTVMFGSAIGFVTATADIIHTDGTKVPGFIFIRGHAVGMLITLHCDDGNTYTVLTKQARVATGNMDFMEIPAGMLDGSGDFKGKAIDELKEETGIQVQRADLVEITERIPRPGLYLSPGGCDEAMRLFRFSAKISTDNLKKLKGRLTGNKHEGEKIELCVKPLDELATIPDMKTVCAYYMYKSLALTPETKYTRTTNNGYVDVADK